MNSFRKSRDKKRREKLFSHFRPVQLHNLNFIVHSS